MFFYTFFLCTSPSSFTYSGRGFDRVKDSFNYWLSHSRQAVERAYGMVTKRWGIYWCIFWFLFDHWLLVVLCTIKLHNLCIDRGVDVPLHRYDHDVLEGDVWQVNDNAREEDAELRGRAVGIIEGKLQVT